MEKIMKRLILILIVGFIGCNTDADIASYNLSKSADMFRLDRRIIFYNGITGKYILTIEGRCSLDKDNMDNQLEVTCKTSETSYKKHYLGISDNVTYFCEQLCEAQVNVYHYKVIFKPLSIIPNVEVK